MMDFGQRSCVHTRWRRSSINKCCAGVTTAVASGPPDEASARGLVFERIAKLLMERAQGCTAVLEELLPPSTATASPNAARLRVPLGCYRVASGNPLRPMLFVPLVGSDGPAVRKMIDPTQSNNPLFDFADARNRVYQCTLSPSSHRYDCVHLARLLFMVNYERLNDAPPVDDDGNPNVPVTCTFRVVNST